MAFSLAFTTIDYDQGKSLLIQDASTGTPWPALTAATITITSLYSGVVLDPATATVTFTQTIAAGFSLEVKNTDLGLDAADTIPDSVYRIVMTVTGSADTYTSDEVCYYNACHTRDSYISTLALSDEVHNQNMDYANWLDFLITGIEANAVAGNSAAIYYTFDIFKNLDE